MRTKYLVACALILGLLCAAPAYAQKPLKKPEKPQTETQTAPTTKSSSKSSSAKSSTESSRSEATTGSINGHEWVDLGLSVKWATCNVGANSPSDYGNYYAWGETTMKNSCTEENSITYGINVENIEGNSMYDVARASWGDSWRLPNKEEIDELVNNTTQVWTTQGEHKGYKVIGLNGNSIFLPAAGYFDSSDSFIENNPFRDVGRSGRYWSATPYEENRKFAYCLDFFYVYSESTNILFGEGFSCDPLNRSSGYPVRPVSE